jgi:hypothetical protein
VILTIQHSCIMKSRGQNVIDESPGGKILTELLFKIVEGLMCQ